MYTDALEGARVRDGSIVDYRIPVIYAYEEKNGVIAGSSDRLIRKMWIKDTLDCSEQIHMAN